LSSLPVQFPRHGEATECTPKRKKTPADVTDRDKHSVLLGAISFQGGAGGIARVARLLGRVLAEEKRCERLQVTGLAFQNGSLNAELGFPIATAGKSRIGCAVKAMRAIRDCDHFISDGCQIAQLGWLPFVSRRPVLAYLHGIEVWEGARRRHLQALRRATMLLANSAYTRDRAERLHGGFARARVCWLGTETDEPVAPVQAGRLHCGTARESRHKVLILGRLEERGYKGHRELIDCWPRVVAAVPDAVLRIVGAGPDEPGLRALAGQSSAAAQIVFAGFVPEAELDAEYARASVFAMPSRAEGFGLVYIEAMRHGLPVIASLHDAAPEVVLDGQTGYTVNLDRPDQLPERIIHLLRNPDQAATLGEAGRRRWAEHFSYSAFRARFLPLLHEFLAS
jgi:phosphatidylinositol alpha-1,6-mannosyltransferase